MFLVAAVFSVSSASPSIKLHLSVLSFFSPLYCMLLMYVVHSRLGLRRSRDVFVPSFLLSFVILASVRFASECSLTVHINALYNESVHGREEHAT